LFISPSKTQLGFTLIELIIVIVIVAIIASLASITSSDKKRELLQTETKRFRVLFDLARQESILQSQQLGIVFSQEGYQFYQKSEQSHFDKKPKPRVAETPLQASDAVENSKPQWTLLQDKILKPRHLPTLLSSQLYIEAILVSLSARKDEKDKDKTQKNITVKPQVFLLSSGENTPLEYQLNYSGIGHANIKIDSIGKIDVSYHFDKQTNE
jgi:general secretion pathway protein H